MEIHQNKTNASHAALTESTFGLQSIGSWLYIKPRNIWKPRPDIYNFEWYVNDHVTVVHVQIFVFRKK